MQERQRHSGSVISLGDMRVSGGDGSLGFCVLCFCAVGGSSKSGVAGEERPSARAAAKMRRRRDGASAAVCVRQRERSAGSR